MAEGRSSQSDYQCWQTAMFPSQRPACYVFKSYVMTLVACEKAQFIKLASESCLPLTNNQLPALMLFMYPPNYQIAMEKCQENAEDSVGQWLPNAIAYPIPRHLLANISRLSACTGNSSWQRARCSISVCGNTLHPVLSPNQPSRCVDRCPDNLCCSQQMPSLPLPFRKPAPHLMTPNEAA